MAGQGTPIRASDYNSIQSTISNVLGTGSGSTGYGQTVTSGQVSVGGKIVASDWVLLRNDLLSARQHQTGANESGQLTPITTTTLVRETDRAAFYNFAQLVLANQNVTPPSGQATLSTFNSSVRSTAWNGTITHTVTLQFPNYNAARYYFNAGGAVQFSASNSNFPSDGSYVKSNDWATMLTNMGTISMNLNSTTTSGSGSAAGSIGFYQLNTGYQTLFTKSTASPTYSPNQYDIRAKVDGTGAIITFIMEFQDLSAPGGYGVDESVEGTLTSTVQGYYASGSNVSVSNYTPSVTSTGP
jgi:hypothetical protein